MIKVRYHDDGNVRVLEISGHAGAAPEGMDIFCAAASTLAISLRDAMTESNVPFDELIDDGYAKFVCEDARARDWFYMAMRGFLTLAEMYPQYYAVTTA